MGYEVVSLDNNPRAHPVGHFICKDILCWDYKVFPVGHFCIIAATPPCTSYSTANNLRPRDFTWADQLVQRVLEIIHYFQPRKWWIENPRHGFLKTREFMQNLNYIDVDYCQVTDWGYQKPTRIWCDAVTAQLPSRICDGQTCKNMERGEDGRLRHKYHLGGHRMKFGTRLKERFPPELVRYLVLEPSSMVQARVNSPEGFLGLVGEEHQMLMRLYFRLPNGEIQLFRALVDTGAQVNLISDKCVPFHLSHAVVPPVRLVAANGQDIEGGQRSVDLDMLCEYGYPHQKQIEKN